MILSCFCPNEAQDLIFGERNRIHSTPRGLLNGRIYTRCSGCGTSKELLFTEADEEKFLLNVKKQKEVQQSAS